MLLVEISSVTRESTSEGCYTLSCVGFCPFSVSTSQRNSLSTKSAYFRISSRFLLSRIDRSPNEDRRKLCNSNFHESKRNLALGRHDRNNYRRPRRVSLFNGYFRRRNNTPSYLLSRWSIPPQRRIVPRCRQEFTNFGHWLHVVDRDFLMTRRCTDEKRRICVNLCGSMQILRWILKFLTFESLNCLRDQSYWRMSRHSRSALAHFRRCIVATRV